MEESKSASAAVIEDINSKNPKEDLNSSKVVVVPSDSSSSSTPKPMPVSVSVTSDDKAKESQCTSPKDVLNNDKGSSNNEAKLPEPSGSSESSESKPKDNSPVNSTSQDSNSTEGASTNAEQAPKEQPGNNPTNTETDESSKKANLITDHDEIAKGNEANENSKESDETLSKTGGKRDRTTAFPNASVLERLPASKDDNSTKSVSSVDEPPQKVPRTDSTDSSVDQKKTGSGGDDSDDSSNDGNVARSNRLSDSDSIASCTIIGPTDGSARANIQNGKHHNEIENTTGTDDEFEMPECDEYFLSLVKLDPIPDADALPPLLPREVAQLELALQIGLKFKDHSDDYSWREDWNGNLQLLDKDLIMNREVLAKNPMAKQITIPFYEHVAKFARHAEDFTCVKYLFAYVYNMKGTPPMAKRILAHYIQCPAASIADRLQFIAQANQRISYDPIVLKQDGWTTAKADTPDGATGGAYLIGRKVMWERSEAIIIAFVRDDNLGDLWKCMWVEDLDTFDLEADELQEGIKRWERKIAREKASSKTSSKTTKTQKSSSFRFEQSRNLSVNGIEDGIILATSYKTKSGRPWPARIMHVTEVKAMGQLTSRRSSSKNEIHVVFLAPYWNSQSVRTTNAKSSYSTGPLFELETIDVSADTIQEYPHDITGGTLSIEKLRAAFAFLGLPKSAFSRYLDSHRIAMSLKSYAHKENKKSGRRSSHVEAFASLTETHPLSIQTFLFPDALLNLPFEYTLEKYPHPTEKAIQDTMFENEESTEPIMKLDLMLDALCPPRCWGGGGISNEESKIATQINSPPKSCFSPIKSPEASILTQKESYSIENFCSEYLINIIASDVGKTEFEPIKTKLLNLVETMNNIITQVESGVSLEVRQEKLRVFLLKCMILKGQGEETFFGPDLEMEDPKQRNCVSEWRKACERIFKRALVRMGHINSGNGVTAILTDSRCNQHITAKGSFERAVRLPAAIKGAKNAGAGSKQSMPLVTKIDEPYMELAEQKIIPMAHKVSYLRRMKSKIAALPVDAKGAPLTDDSDGEGGEDTMGSRGSYTAAVVGVAAALKAVDMVVGGKCVNSFCAIRPPGHHAGKELRAMGAISNGFCLLNAAACAALYAVRPLSEGGLGLKRVCVVDIDVHHGNGTQDILASTYDPRFLYISTHAGGPHINGYSDDKSDDGIRRNLNNKDGIFPGRCGDLSPHEGVLNLPLGQKITPSALGTALVCQVTPAIEKFSPELIIISAGFDAHKNDPLGLGGLSAEDFGTVTSVLCQVALKICSGRVVSILEGGYGVPCCRPLDTDIFLPDSEKDDNQKKPLKLLNLGEDLPDSMEDRIDIHLSQKLDKCHQEGFLECVKEHVLNLSTSSDVEPRKS